MSESRIKAQKLVNALRVQAQKIELLQAELAGALNVIWVLAKQNGGSIVLTAEELKDVPEGSKLQTLYEEKEDQFVFLVKTYDTPENPHADTDEVKPLSLEGYETEQ